MIEDNNLFENNDNENEDFSDDVGEPWRSEIERRRQDFRDGKANPVSGDEALRQAYAAIG